MDIAKPFPSSLPVRSAVDDTGAVAVETFVETLQARPRTFGLDGGLLFCAEI